MRKRARGRSADEDGAEDLVLWARRRAGRARRGRTKTIVMHEDGRHAGGLDFRRTFSGREKHTKTNAPSGSPCAARGSPASPGPCVQTASLGCGASRGPFGA